MIGWTDYAKVTGMMPIETQVHQVWWIVQNLDKLNSGHEKEPYENLFLSITSLPQADREQGLRDAIARTQETIPELLQDPGTDPRPLILPWTP